MPERVIPPEVLLAQLAQQVNDNYTRFPSELHGARVVFGIDEGWWTIIFEPASPRLFRGAIAPEDPENDPFLVLQGTAAQLDGLLRSTLDLEDEANRAFGFEGNCEALHTAIGDCI